MTPPSSFVRGSPTVVRPSRRRGTRPSQLLATNEHDRSCEEERQPKCGASLRMQACLSLCLSAVIAHASTWDLLAREAVCPTVADDVPDDAFSTGKDVLECQSLVGATYVQQTEVG